MNEIEELVGEMLDEIEANDKERLLKEFQLLSEEVEERLQLIENTERELDRWRDEQLHKNRIFWDGSSFSCLFSS